LPASASPPPRTRGSSGANQLAIKGDQGRSSGAKHPCASVHTRSVHTKNPFAKPLAAATAPARKETVEEIAARMMADIDDIASTSREARGRSRSFDDDAPPKVVGQRDGQPSPRGLAPSVERRSPTARASKERRTRDELFKSAREQLEEEADFRIWFDPIPRGSISVPISPKRVRSSVTSCRSWRVGGLHSRLLLATRCERPRLHLTTALWKLLRQLTSVILKAWASHAIRSTSRSPQISEFIIRPRHIQTHVALLHCRVVLVAYSVKRTHPTGADPFAVWEVCFDQKSLVYPEPPDVRSEVLRCDKNLLLASCSIGNTRKTTYGTEQDHRTKRPCFSSGPPATSFSWVRRSRTPDVTALTHGNFIMQGTLHHSVRFIIHGTLHHARERLLPPLLGGRQLALFDLASYWASYWAS